MGAAGMEADGSDSCVQNYFHVDSCMWNDFPAEGGSSEIDRGNREEREHVYSSVILVTCFSGVCVCFTCILQL